MLGGEAADIGGGVAGGGILGSRVSRKFTLLQHGGKFHSGRLLDWNGQTVLHTLVTIEQKTDEQNESAAALPRRWLLLLAGLGWGIGAGLIEAAGLLVFQRLNWARWGPMMHVAKEIFWISPVVDAIFFCSLAVVCGIVVRFAPRLPAVRVIVFLLTFLTV